MAKIVEGTETPTYTGSDMAVSKGEGPIFKAKAGDCAKIGDTSTEPDVDHAV